jgi:histone arginine demethylase JMJD6
MSKKRSLLKKDQWYVGWSICNPRLQKIFRKHYSRPTFLPDDSESSAIDWIFMGGHGHGAMIHVDSVNRPSWQAQVSGRKTWTLEPPPECESVCTRHLNATMSVGDILVVDTNYWYHGTIVHPGDMAITIGSEYD